MLRTRTGRILFLLFVGLVGGGAIYLFVTAKPLEPWQMYYYAVRSNVPDARTPTGRKMVEMFFPWIGNDYLKYCPDHGAGSYSYQGITLCRPQPMSDAEFTERMRYFETLVDDSYSRYRTQKLSAALFGAVAGFSIWLCCWAVYRLFRWVKAAPAQ